MRCLLIYLIVPFFITSIAMAEPLNGLAAYLDQEITLYDQAIAACPKIPDTAMTFGSSGGATESELGEDQEDERMHFAFFYVRARPRVSFSLPGLVTVQIIPEIEMLWQRQNPSQWELYRP